MLYGIISHFSSDRPLWKIFWETQVLLQIATHKLLGGSFHSLAELPPATSTFASLWLVPDFRLILTQRYFIALHCVAFAHFLI